MRKNKVIVVPSGTKGVATYGRLAGPVNCASQVTGANLRITGGLYIG